MHRMEKVNLGLTGMAWNGGSWLWPNINGSRNNWFAPLSLDGWGKNNLRKEHKEEEEQVGAPTVSSAVIRGSNELEDFPCPWHVKMSQCHNVSHLFHVSINNKKLHLHFFEHFVSLCHIVSQYGTCHECHTCDICHTCHKYQNQVSLVIKCVIGGLLVTDFNQVWGWRREVGKKWFQGLRLTYL
jgi:hypothetical protein